MTEIKSLLGVLADSVTLNPARSVRHLRLVGSATESGPVAFHSGAHEIPVDVSPDLGGDDDAPEPLAYALAALGSCQVVAYRWWAARLDLALDRVDIVVEADVDLRGVLGTDADVGPSPQHVGMRVTLAGPEPAERYVELRDAVDRHSPVLHLFAHDTPVTSNLIIERGAPT